jgi:hypothetical protein
MANEKINCQKCIYYYVTWDPSFPKGCKLYGFKSMNFPYILVRQSTGLPCDKFTPREK